MKRASERALYTKSYDVIGSCTSTMQIYNAKKHMVLVEEFLGEGLRRQLRNRYYSKWRRLRDMERRERILVLQQKLEEEKVEAERIEEIRKKVYYKIANDSCRGLIL